MSLRKRAEERAKQTVEATKKIGFIGQVKLVTGVAPRLYEDWQETDNCFVPNDFGTDEEVRAEVFKRVKKYTGRDKPDIYPCLSIQVVPDTSLTPNSKFSGNTYISTEGPGKHPRTLKRASDFLFDHMSSELEDLEGKKVWVHLSWNRLTEQYGGDLKLQDREETRNEWGIIVTYLPTKKDAVGLANDLVKDVVTMDELATARGYDAPGVRKMQYELLNADKDKDGKNAKATSLTGIGPVTKKHYMTLAGFLEPTAIEFLTTNFKTNGGDVEATAVACGADPGDVAIVLGQQEYFRSLITQQGDLSETEAVLKVAELTGLANAVDLAKFLNIDEAAF